MLSGAGQIPVPSGGDPTKQENKIWEYATYVISMVVVGLLIALLFSAANAVSRSLPVSQRGLAGSDGGVAAGVQCACHRLRAVERLSGLHGPWN